MFVAASTLCWPDCELVEAIDRLTDLDFTAVEIAIGDHLPIKPRELTADPDHAVQVLRSSHRMDISAYGLDLDPEAPDHDEVFAAFCRIAKTTKVVNVVVPSAPHGTPFNEEVERLQRQVTIGEDEGIRVSVRSQLNCLSDDPDTLMVLCNNVDGLGITLDPSVYITGQAKGKNLDKILKFVCNVHLRDTRPDAFQVSVGQGVVDYAKLMTQLDREGYKRALTVNMAPMPDHDHRVELRKLRRLLETLL